MNIPVKNIRIPSYIFREDTNPFAFDARSKKSLAKVAFAIKNAIEEVADKNKILIRGIQSGKHGTDREALVDKIIQEGADGYSEEVDGHGILFAAHYDGLQTIEFILAGFHEFKPKCEERPQYPIDVWMIFDESAFKNIKYVHPRHSTTANDKWQIVDLRDHGLHGVIVIN